MSTNKTKSYWIYQNGALILAVIGLGLILSAFVAAQLLGDKISLLRLLTDSLSKCWRIIFNCWGAAMDV